MMWFDDFIAHFIIMSALFFFVLLSSVSNYLCSSSFNSFPLKIKTQPTKVSVSNFISQKNIHSIQVNFDSTRKTKKGERKNALKKTSSSIEQNSILRLDE